MPVMPMRSGCSRRVGAWTAPAIRRGLLSGLAGLLALAHVGCTVWIGKRDLHVQWDERRVVEERVIGEARASAVAHADGLGWTVDVQEPVEQVLARTGKRWFTAHRFYVAPGLSWGVAALGCGVGIPMGVPVLALNALVGRWDMFTERYVPEVLVGGCAYPLIGLVPGGRNLKTWEAVEDPEHREEAWRPVSEAEVGVRLAGRPWIRYPVEPDGQRSVRVEHVPLAVEGAGVEAVELGVWVRGAVLRTWTETVSEAARKRLAEEPRVPREAWPARLTVGVWGWEGLPGAVGSGRAAAGGRDHAGRASARRAGALALVPGASRARRGAAAAVRGRGGRAGASGRGPGSGRHDPGTAGGPASGDALAGRRGRAGRGERHGLDGGELGGAGGGARERRGSGDRAGRAAVGARAGARQVDGAGPRGAVPVLGSHAQ
ncbi:hypothetical protein [Nitrospira calida]